MARRPREEIGSIVEMDPSVADVLLRRSRVSKITPTLWDALLRGQVEFECDHPGPPGLAVVPPRRP